MSPPAPVSDEREWHGDYVRYDLIKEFVVALAVITALTVVLAVLFSSPDDQPVTIQNWSQADPGDFVATAVTELDGTSELAAYGPPYNDTPGAGQKVLGVSPRSAGRECTTGSTRRATSCSIHWEPFPATRG